jgi:phage terminase Nu1 subunit (DNA packaging protein)
MGKIVNRNECSAIFGVSAKTVTHWINSGMPGTRSRGSGVSMKIDTAAAINWYVEREKEKELAGLRAALRLARGLEPHGTRSEEELRLIAAKRKLAELEAAEKGGTMGLIEDFQESANQAMLIISSQDDAIAGRLANELAAESSPAVVRAKLFEALRENRAAAAERLRHWAAGSDNHLAGLPTA